MIGNEREQIQSSDAVVSANGCRSEAGQEALRKLAEEKWKTGDAVRWGMDEGHSEGEHVYMLGPTGPFKTCRLPPPLVVEGLKHIKVAREKRKPAGGPCRN